MKLMGASPGTEIVSGSTGTTEQSRGFGAQGSSSAQSSGTTGVLRQVEQLVVAAKETNIA